MMASGCSPAWCGYRRLDTDRRRRDAPPQASVPSRVLRQVVNRLQTHRRPIRGRVEELGRVKLTRGRHGTVTHAEVELRAENSASRFH